jgi:transcriptional regulator with XRE-family HTH domain
MGMDGKSVASKFVRDLRHGAGMSQRALAAASGVPQPTIAEIEGGRREPSLSLLSRLAEATGQVLTVGLEPLHPRSAVATANRVRDRLSGPAGEGWSTELRQDGALRAVIDFKDALGSATAEEFEGLVQAPPVLTGETRWDALIAAVVEDESATRDAPPPYWTNEKSRFVRPLWYLSDNKALHAWELATAPGAFVRHGVLAARAELESV